MFGKYIMKNILLIILIFTTSNCFAQHIKCITISYGEFFQKPDNFFQVVCNVDSDVVCYSHNMEEQHKIKGNEFSQAILNIDEPTFQQYINKSSNNHQDRFKEMEQMSLFNYLIHAEYSDGTSDRFLIPALLYLLTDDVSKSEKYKYYMNNMFFLMKSCFKTLDFPACGMSL